VYLKQGGNELVVKSGGYVRNQGYEIAAQATPTVKDSGEPNDQRRIADGHSSTLPKTLLGNGCIYAAHRREYRLGLTMEVDDSFDWCLINSALAALDTIM